MHFLFCLLEMYTILNFSQVDREVYPLNDVIIAQNDVMSEKVGKKNKKKNKKLKK